MVEEEAKEEEEEEGGIAIHMQAGGGDGRMQGEGKGLERETNLEDSPFAIRRKKKVVVESNFGEKESFLPHVACLCLEDFGVSPLCYFSRRERVGTYLERKESSINCCILRPISSKKE